MTREKRRLSLRLAVTSHGAIGHEAAVTQHRKSGIEGVKRLATRRKRVERLRVEREARPAVLHQHPGRRQHAARPEFPVVRLNAGHHEPAGIRCPHPHRVAGVSPPYPPPQLRERREGIFSGPSAVDLYDLGLEEFAVEMTLRWRG